MYSRVFEENESPGGEIEIAPSAPEKWRLRQGEIAYFRNDQWEYEPDPDWADPNAETE